MQTLYTPSRTAKQVLLKYGDWQRFRCIVWLFRRYKAATNHLPVAHRILCLPVAMNQRSSARRDARIPVLVIAVWIIVLVSMTTAALREETGEAAGSPGVLVVHGERLLLTGESSSMAGAVDPRLMALVCGKVPVNRAGTAVLQTVPGIGPELARRIVAERQRAGVFGGAETLTRVSGIGPVRARQFREFLLFD